MTTAQPDPPPSDSSQEPDTVSVPALSTTTPSDRGPHRLTAALISVALIPMLAFLLFTSLLSGPKLFFGEYSSDGGRHAIVLACLVLLASLGWAWFFAVYRQAAPVSILGLVISAASAVIAVLLIYGKSADLRNGPGAQTRDSANRLDPWLVTLPIGLTVIAVAAGLALCHPRLRPAGLAVTALFAVTGGCFFVTHLVGGGLSLPVLAAMASPMVLGLVTFASVWRAGRAGNHP